MIEHKGHKGTKAQREEEDFEPRRARVREELAGITRIARIYEDEKKG